MRGVLALLLIAGGLLFGYDVATGKFPAIPALSSSSSGTPALTGSQAGQAAGNAALLATGNGPSGAVSAGLGLPPGTIGTATGATQGNAGKQFF